jgi:hypothetical protein
MGKATIISGGDDGLYTIEVDLGQARKAAMIAAINADIAKANANIAAADLVLSAATSAATTAAVAFNATIEAYVRATQESTDPATLKDEIEAYEAAFKVMREKQAAMYLAQINVRNLQAVKAELVKRLGVVQSITDTIAQSAWCADLTDDATGEVATLEVPGEQDLIIIQPAAPAATAGDGQLTARGIQTPEQVYFNAATLPGWQKWMPTYRTGTITAIDTDADTADVTLDAATSSAQALDVNLQTELPACPVEYMTCNAAAFEEGDHVVVRFDTGLWSGQRTVIGFVDNPRPCIDWPAEISARIRWLTSVSAAGSGLVEVVQVGDHWWNCTPNGYNSGKNEALPDGGKFYEDDASLHRFELQPIMNLGGVFTATAGFSSGTLHSYNSNKYLNSAMLDAVYGPPQGGDEDGVCFEARAEIGSDSIEVLRLKAFWQLTPEELIFSQIGFADLCTYRYSVLNARVIPTGSASMATELGPLTVLEFLQNYGGASSTITLEHIETGRTKQYQYSEGVAGGNTLWTATWTRVDE